MRRKLPLKLALPFLAALLLAAASGVSAQGGGTEVEPVDGAVAEVQYMIDQTLDPPENGTEPGNETEPPEGNETVPPEGNETVPPEGNETVPPGGNETVPPEGNETVPPEGNETTPPEGNETAPPDGNETTPPDGNETLPPDGNETLPPDGNETSPPGDGGTAPPGDGTAGGGDGVGDETGDGSGDGNCTTCVLLDVNATVLGELGAGDGPGGGRSRCMTCDGQGLGTPVDRGFPWLPLLVTLTMAPLVGLLVARKAIKRWEVTKPPVKSYGPTRPPYDPMREFMRDVQEWKSMPVPGAEPVPSAK